MKLENLPPWEILMKKIVWLQLGEISGKKILDFGSGTGVTADYLAAENEVIAIEPAKQSFDHCFREHEYQQLCGSTELLCQFADAAFDLIICHNVLEYAADRAEIVRHFMRILKKDGSISVVKHNRPGRVMQMVVLLNDFEKAQHLLDGGNGMSSDYGEIRYYEDAEPEQWCPDLYVSEIMGIRTFWDLQQNQQLHSDSAWQEKMIEMEMKVSRVREYRDIAFFHHLILKKRSFRNLTQV